MVPIVPSRILCLCCCCLVYSLQLSPCTCWSIAPSTVPPLPYSTYCCILHPAILCISRVWHLETSRLETPRILRPSPSHILSTYYMLSSCVSTALSNSLHSSFSSTSSVALGTYTPYSMYSTCTPTLSTCSTILHIILPAIARTPYSVYLHTMYLHPVLRCMTPIPRSLVPILTATL